MKLIALVGTNSNRSINRQLLQSIQTHFADKAEIELIEIKNIPMFNKPADKQVPELVKEIAAKIDAADGVIIGTPEYDHSIPVHQKSKPITFQMNFYCLTPYKPLTTKGN